MFNFDSINFIAVVNRNKEEIPRTAAVSSSNCTRIKGVPRGNLNLQSNEGSELFLHDLSADVVHFFSSGSAYVVSCHVPPESSPAEE